MRKPLVTTTVLFFIAACILRAQGFQILHGFLRRDFPSSTAYPGRISQRCLHALSPSCSRRRVASSKTIRMAGSDEADFDMSAFISEVERREDTAACGPAIDGPELKQLIMDKWRYPLDTRIHRRRDALGQMTVWLQVMWKHVWEASFPMTEEEYDAQLDAVAWFLTEWGKADYVRESIANTDKSPGLNQSGKGQSVLIKLDVTAEQQRMMFDDAV